MLVFLILDLNMIFCTGAVFLIFRFRLSRCSQGHETFECTFDFSTGAYDCFWRASCLSVSFLLLACAETTAAHAVFKDLHF